MTALIDGDWAAAVIMAGGVGERFWPASRRDRPKQLIPLFDGQSLLRLTFDRAARLVGANRVYVVAGDGLRSAIADQLPALAPERYIAEPYGRNTAACLGLAACALEAAAGPDTVMAVLTADHRIEEGPAFRAAVLGAIGHARHGEDLVTIGMRPTRPETGYGYLALGEPLGTEPTAEGDVTIHRVRRFVEKPERRLAEEFFESSDYLWNSGMFFWRVGTFLEEFKRCQPEMARAWETLRRHGPPPYPLSLVAEIYERLPSLPVDKALLERTDHVAAVRGTFPWSDLGSWDALEAAWRADGQGNVHQGAVIVLESANCVLYNEGAPEGPAADAPGGPATAQSPVVVFGMEGIVAVRTDRAILIAPKSRAQELRSVVQFLRDSGRGELL